METGLLERIAQPTASPVQAAHDGSLRDVEHLRCLPVAQSVDVDQRDHGLVVTIGTGPQQAPDEVTGTIGVEDGGQAQDAAEALTGAQVVPYPSAMDLDRALDSGEVDAALVTFSGRDRLAADRDVTVLARIPIDDQTVLLFPLGADEELVDAVDAALARLLDDGAYVELEERWLGR